MIHISHQILRRIEDSHHILHHHPTLCSTNSDSSYSSAKMDKDKSKIKSIIRMNAKSNMKSSRIVLSPALISVVLFIHILSNQSFLSSILEAGKGFRFVSSDDLARLDNKIAGSRRIPASGVINFVSANPAPLPASPSNSQASTSRSNRGPPINGSMFGKRSVINSLPSSSSLSASSTTKETTAALDYIKAKNNQNKMNSQQKSQSSPAVRIHSVNSYHDIVTEIIENFLASNNESEYYIMII